MCSDEYRNTLHKFKTAIKLITVCGFIQSLINITSKVNKRGKGTWESKRLIVWM